MGVASSLDYGVDKKAITLKLTQVKAENSHINKRMHKELSLAQTSSNLIEYLTCRPLKKKSMMLQRNQSLIVRNFPLKFCRCIGGLQWYYIRLRADIIRKDSHYARA
jgi:hypothetical protein